MIVKLKLYSEIHNISVEDDETILTSAMEQGVEPPFSCQIGICSTCRAKLESGTISMDCHDSLTDEEVDEGWVLTCQAHPVSNNVYLNYDY